MRKKLLPIHETFTHTLTLYQAMCTYHEFTQEEKFSAVQRGLGDDFSVLYPRNAEERKYV